MAVIPVEIQKKILPLFYPKLQLLFSDLTRDKKENIACYTSVKVLVSINRYFKASSPRIWDILI